jgi:hypothetical protein
MDLHQNYNYSQFFKSAANEKFESINLEDTALFTGHAKLPSGIALYEFLKVISCALIVEIESGKVINATFTTISSMTGSYVSSMVIGWSFNDGFDVLEKRFDKHCHISSKKACLKAIEVAGLKYRDFVNQSKLKND